MEKVDGGLVSSRVAENDVFCASLGAGLRSTWGRSWHHSVLNAQRSLADSNHWADDSESHCEKTAIIWIAYVAGTSEERIFSSHNWADEFPDVDNIQQHYRLPLSDEQDDVVTDPSTGLVLIGGEDTLQFDRDLTDEEIDSIESQLTVGQPHVEQGSIISSCGGW